MLLLTPAYSLDACRPAEQTTADERRPNRALGLFLEQYTTTSSRSSRYYAADVMTSINRNPSNHH